MRTVVLRMRVVQQLGCLRVTVVEVLKVGLESLLVCDISVQLLTV